MGLLAPVTICLKLLLQSLAVGNSPWDEPLEGDLLSKSREALYRLVLAQDIEYPCSIKPEQAEGLLELCGWWDGGAPASTCCVYARYKLESRGTGPLTHSVRLVMGKARVTPSSKTSEKLRKSTPRTEM